MLLTVGLRLSLVSCVLSVLRFWGITEDSDSLSQACLQAALAGYLYCARRLPLELNVLWHVIQITLLLGEAMIRVNAFGTSGVAGVLCL